MRIYVAKLLLAIAVINGVSAEANSLARGLSHELASAPAAIQADGLRAYGFFKSVLDYLSGSGSVRLKPQDSGRCGPKRIESKKH